MRFTDEKKGSDKWFRSLKPCHKIVWIYICDNCDIAGFYEVDIESIAFHTRLTEAESKGAIEGLSRGYLGADGHIWIKKFLKHQNNHLLNPSNNCHKGIIKRIQMNLSLFPDIPKILGATEGLFSPTSKSKGNSNSNVEVNVVVKEKDQINSEVDISKTKHVEPMYHHYFKLFQDIKPYNIVPIRSEVISLFREAAQEVPEVQILEAAANYKLHLNHADQPVDFRKSVKTFLSEKQYKIDWLMQHKINKRGDSPKELFDLWIARNQKYPDFKWST